MAAILQSDTLTRAFSWIVVLLIVNASGNSFGSPTSPTIGAVKEIRSGVLERQDRDVWNPLLANAEIRANDRVRTGPGATAVLTLNDIGSVLIGPSTEYYLGDPSRGFKSLLKRGYLWVSTKLKPGATMSVATTSAVTGVRGTKFSVIQDAQGMDTCTCKGEVQVTLKDGKSATVASGMYGSVNAAGKMSAPEKGKPLLQKIWKENPPRYAPCLNCHRKGKKISDLE
jgi:hypothetical protein